MYFRRIYIYNRKYASRSFKRALLFIMCGRWYEMSILFFAISISNEIDPFFSYKFHPENGEMLYYSSYLLYTIYMVLVLPPEFYYIFIKI